jgi:hypothetical protein
MGRDMFLLHMPRRAAQDETESHAAMAYPLAEAVRGREQAGQVMNGGSGG